jgi:hypothetical protein
MKPSAFLEQSVPTVSYGDHGRGKEEGSIHFILMTKQILPRPLLRVPVMPKPSKSECSAKLFKIFYPEATPFLRPNANFPFY